jgi:hypothetical protein
LVDFDGDGRLHLLAGSHCCDGLGFHLFRRQQDGSWAPRQRLAVTPAPGLQLSRLARNFVTAADWNGDGIPDLLFSSSRFAPGVFVAYGPLRGGDPIALAYEIPIQPKGTVFAVAVADWDGDGKPDLLVAQTVEGKGGIYWYKNLGGAAEPRLAKGRLLVADSSSDDIIRGFCVCDWNADGRPDLVVTRDVLSPANPKGKRVRWQGAVWLYLHDPR